MTALLLDDQTGHRRVEKAVERFPVVGPVDGSAPSRRRFWEEDDRVDASRSPSRRCHCSEGNVDSARRGGAATSSVSGLPNEWAVVEGKRFSPASGK